AGGAVVEEAGGEEGLAAVERDLHALDSPRATGERVAARAHPAAHRLAVARATDRRVHRQLAELDSAVAGRRLAADVGGEEPVRTGLEVVRRRLRLDGDG